jgi:hypothetical protein
VIFIQPFTFQETPQFHVEDERHADVNMDALYLSTNMESVLKRKYVRIRLEALQHLKIKVLLGRLVGSIRN